MNDVNHTIDKSHSDGVRTNTESSTQYDINLAQLDQSTNTTSINYNNLDVDTHDISTHTNDLRNDNSTNTFTPTTQHMQQYMNAAQQWLYTLQFMYAQQYWNKQGNKHDNIDNNNNSSIDTKHINNSNDNSNTGTQRDNKHIQPISTVNSNSDGVNVTVNNETIHPTKKQRTAMGTGNYPCIHTCWTNNDISNSSKLCSYSMHDKSGVNRHADNVLHPYCHKQCNYHTTYKTRINNARTKLKRIPRSIRYNVNYPSILLDPPSNWCYINRNAMQQINDQHNNNEHSITTNIKQAPSRLQTNVGRFPANESTQSFLKRRNLQLFTHNNKCSDTHQTLHNGDSLYIAYLLATQQHVTINNIQKLRDHVATYMTDHRDVFDLYIDETNCKLIQSNVTDYTINPANSVISHVDVTTARSQLKSCHSCKSAIVNNIEQVTCKQCLYKYCSRTECVKKWNDSSNNSWHGIQTIFDNNSTLICPHCKHTNNSTVNRVNSHCQHHNGSLNLESTFTINNNYAIHINDNSHINTSHATSNDDNNTATTINNSLTTVYGYYEWHNFDDYTSHVRAMNRYVGYICEPELLALSHCNNTHVSFHIHEIRQTIDKRYRCCNDSQCNHKIIQLWFDRVTQTYHALQSVDNNKHDNYSNHSNNSYDNNQLHTTSLHRLSTDSNHSMPVLISPVNSNVHNTFNIIDNSINNTLSLTTHARSSSAPSYQLDHTIQPLPILFNDDVLCNNSSNMLYNTLPSNTTLDNPDA